MKSRKFLAVVLVLLLAFAFVPVVDAFQVRVNSTESGHARVLNLDGPETIGRVGNEEITIDVVDSSMIAAGAANGGATSMATSTTAVPVTYAHVNMAITTADPAFTAKTLADGKKGQILTIHVYNGSNATTITPATSTAFSVLTFNAVDDSVTLLFADSTTGWLLMSSTSVTITP
ncbi:MAG: hypothetical protein KAJ18_11875 [Candidatus Omnitrophica bacterium]|nr:hypothetical protein [Candidatus Omnitrophota bacterium]